MVERYCSACGNELAEDSNFCSKCGRPLHETAQVNTTHADVRVPPPPYAQQEASAYPTHVSSQAHGVERVSATPYWITFATLAVLALWARASGSVVVFIGVVVATVWVYRDVISRGMEGAGVWAAGVLLLFIVIFPLYFVRRRPHT